MRYVLQNSSRFILISLPKIVSIKQKKLPESVDEALTRLRFASGPGSLGASLCEVNVMPIPVAAFAAVTGIVVAVCAPMAGRIIVVVPVLVLTCENKIVMTK